MKVRSLHIDSFRQLRGLEVDALQPGLTIIEGPNEAGKSSLRAFIAWMLFGPRGKDAERGMESARGRLVVEHEGRALELVRGPGQFDVRATDGKPHPAWSDVVGGTDRALFDAVYCLGLSELNALQALDHGALKDRLAAAAIGGAAESARALRERLAADANAIWANDLSGRLHALDIDLERARVAVAASRRKTLDHAENTRHRDSATDRLAALGRAIADGLAAVERLRLRSEAVPLARDLSKLRSDRLALGPVPAVDERDLDRAVLVARVAQDAAARRDQAAHEAEQASADANIPVANAWVEHADIVRELAAGAAKVSADVARRPGLAESASAAAARREEAVAALGGRAGRVDLEGSDVPAAMRDALREQAAQRAERARDVAAELTASEHAAANARSELQRVQSEAGGATVDEAILRVGDGIERLVARAPLWEKDLHELDQRRAAAAARTAALAEVGPVPTLGLPADSAAFAALLASFRSGAEAVRRAAEQAAQERARVGAAADALRQELARLRSELATIPGLDAAGASLEALEAARERLDGAGEAGSRVAELETSIGEAEATIERMTSEIGLDPAEISNIDASLARRQQLRDVESRLREATDALRKAEGEIAKLSAEFSAIPNSGDPTADLLRLEQQRAAFETVELARSGRAPDAPGDEQTLSLPTVAAVVTIGLAVGAGFVAAFLALGYAGPEMRPVGAAVAGVLLAVVVPVLAAMALYYVMSNAAEVPEDQRREAMIRLEFPAEHWPTDAEMAAVRTRIEEGLEAARRRESDAKKRALLGADLEKQMKTRDQCESDLDRYRSQQQEGWQGSGWRRDRDLASLDRIAELAELRARRNAEIDERSRLADALAADLAHVRQTLADAGASGIDDAALSAALDEQLLLARIAAEGVEQAKVIESKIESSEAELAALENGDTVEAADAAVLRAQTDLSEALAAIGVEGDFPADDVSAWCDRVEALSATVPLGRDETLADLEAAAAADAAALREVVDALGRSNETSVGPDLLRELGEALHVARASEAARASLQSAVESAIRELESSEQRMRDAEVGAVTEAAAEQAWREQAIVAGYPAELRPGEFADFDRVWHDARHAHQRNAQVRAELLAIDEGLDDWTSRAMVVAARVGEPAPASTGDALAAIPKWVEQLAEVERAAAARREAEVVASVKQQALERAEADFAREKAASDEALGAVGCDGVDGIEPLRQRLRDASRLDNDMADRRQRLAGLLGAVDDAALASLVAEDDVALRSSLDAAQRTLAEEQAEQEALKLRLAALNHDIDQAEQSTELLAAEQELASLEASRERLVRQLAQSQLASGLVAEAVEALRSRLEPAVLRSAGSLLGTISGGRWLKVEGEVGEGGGLYVVAGDRTRRPVDELSLGTAEQLYLSLRLSLAADESGRGRNFPLILDDVFVNFDRERSMAMAAALAEVAKRQQVFFLTARPDAVEQLCAANPGANVLRMTRLPVDGATPRIERVTRWSPPDPIRVANVASAAPAQGAQAAPPRPVVAPPTRPAEPREFSEEDLNDPRLPKILDFLRQQAEPVTRREIELALGMREIEAKALMRILSEQGSVEAIGATKGRRYRAV